MPEEQEQRLRAHYAIEPEEKVPADPGRLWILPRIRRVFAFLYGISGGAAVRLACDSSGYLKVNLAADDVSSGAPVSVDTEFMILSGNETGAGVGDASYVEKVFTATCRCVDLFIWDNPATVKIDPTGSAYTAEFEVPADTVFSIPSVCKKISVKNKGAGNDARWQAVGWIGA